MTVTAWILGGIGLFAVSFIAMLMVCPHAVCQVIGHDFCEKWEGKWVKCRSGSQPKHCMQCGKDFTVEEYASLTKSTH